MKQQFLFLKFDFRNLQFRNPHPSLEYSLKRFSFDSNRYEIEKLSEISKQVQNKLSPLYQPALKTQNINLKYIGIAVCKNCLDGDPRSNYHLKLFCFFRRFHRFPLRKSLKERFFRLRKSGPRSPWNESFLTTYLAMEINVNWRQLLLTQTVSGPRNLAHQKRIHNKQNA